MKATLRQAFTLVELLVVIAIIGVLVAALMPAVQASRDMAHRASCANNVAQLLLAVQNYEDANASFPPGCLNPDGPIRSEPVGQHISWLVHLLPYLDEGAAYRNIDVSKGAYDAANAPVREVQLETFLCPANPSSQRGRSDYAACHHDVEAPIAADNNGVFFLNSHVRRDDITDGASHTLFIGENSTGDHELGWMSGTRATLRNTGSPLNSPPPMSPDPTFVGGFSSVHQGGVTVGFGDGRVKLLPDTIDLKVWQQLGNRADGKLLNVGFSD